MLTLCVMSSTATGLYPGPDSDIEQNAHFIIFLDQIRILILILNIILIRPILDRDPDPECV